MMEYMPKKIEAGWEFQNSYATLDEKLFSRILPTPVKSPAVAVFNHELAERLGLDFSGLPDTEIAAVLSGNCLPEGAMPIAQAYAGHQFGHFTMLGDGRAILLGEQVTPGKVVFDVQLKGCGRTPYSRNGDGRATLSSMLREYLISEAIHRLGVPTTRSLAVVTTGEEVVREQKHRGAVLTRIATSHIRVGTFEYVRYYFPDYLKTFTDYVIQRHYPDLSMAENPAIELLRAVMMRQIGLIVNWIRVGLIHGVMNTDNMSIAGETIDYGPCAFINVYHPKKVFSSIDHYGRYSFGNQSVIAEWNLGCLAVALLPLIHKDEEKAIVMARETLATYDKLFREKWMQVMCKKIGIETPRKNDGVLIEELLNWMQLHEADYTNTFLSLEAVLSNEAISSNEATSSNEAISSNEATLSFEVTPSHEAILSKAENTNSLFSEAALSDWIQSWKQRVSLNKGGMGKAIQLMIASNPAIIPRNHLVEEALASASLNNDYHRFHALMKALHDPYTRPVHLSAYQSPPEHGDEGYQTFCGT